MNLRIINVGNRIINNYIIEINERYLLIDTGYQEQFKNFCKKLELNNIGLEEIAYIFLTHAHDDHAGFLNELLDNSNAKVILNEKAVQRLKIGQNSFEGGCSSYLSLFFCKIMRLFGKGEHKFPSVDSKKRYMILNADSRAEIEEKLSASIIDLPGHTTDSIGLLLNDGSLFCGDAAMNGFPSKNRITIWIENLDEYKESWRKILRRKPVMIYPSHGKPFVRADIEKNFKKLDKVKLHALKSN